MTDRLARLERAICECVEDHREEGVRLLQSLIQSRSYSNEEGTAGDETSMVGKVYAAVRTHGTEVDVQPVGPESENVIEVLRGEGPRSFVLEAHTDTVPEGDPSGWYQEDPFSGAEGFVGYLGDNRIEIDMGEARYHGVIRDQMARVWDRRPDRRRPIIYGRGAFDNKGCVVPVIMALQALVEALPTVGETLAGSVIGGYTVDEEAGTLGVRRFACGPDSWLATHGFLGGPADEQGFLTEVSGISLDGSYGWVPVVGHRGSLQLAITVHGLAAHAATPQLGINAVEQASRIILRLVEGQDEIRDRLLRYLNPALLGLPTMAIGTTIVGGGIHSVINEPSGPRVERGGVNSIPNWCETTLDIRFPAGFDYPRDIEDGYRIVFETVRDYLAETIRPEGWSYEIRPVEGSGSPPVELGPSFEACAGLPIVRRATQRGREILGYEPPMEIAPGGTDATLMIHEGHIPTLVEFGPAGGLSHNTHEFVERDDLAAGAKILALLAVDTLGLAG